MWGLFVVTSERSVVRRAIRGLFKCVGLVHEWCDQVECMPQPTVKLTVQTRSRSRQGDVIEGLVGEESTTAPGAIAPQVGHDLGSTKEEELAVQASEDEQLGQSTLSSEDGDSEVSIRQLGRSPTQSKEEEEASEEEDLQLEENENNRMAEQRGHQIVPPTFRDGTRKSVEEYLAQYERVAKANGWNDAKKLVILPCYLEGAALTWFENLEQQQRPEEDLTWQQVKEGMKEVFQTIARDEQMEYRLRMRMQGEEETVESYVQDVLNLCIKVDPGMNEGIKIRYILRGLKPSLLEKVMILENDTIAHLMTNIRRVQTARYMAGQRVDQLMGPPTPSTTEVVQPGASGTTRLENQLEHLTSEFSKLSMRLLESQAIATRSSRERQQPTRRDPPPRREEEVRREESRGGGLRGRGRGAARHPMGRTPDGRVICYKCNKVGHYAVNCRNYQQSGNEEEGR